MYNATEQFAGFSKSGIAQATRLATLVLENAEKLGKVNLLAAKSALAQGIEGARAVAAARDVQQLVAVNATLAEAGMRAAMGYSKNLYAIATEAQVQYATLAEESRAAYAKGAAAWVDRARKTA